MGILQNNQVEYDDELHVRHEIIKIILYIAGIILLVFLVNRFIGSRSEVVGHSMEGTLHDGESVWMDKLSYRFQSPKRYDIVIFPYQGESSYLYIKRIIGLPGETIYIDEDGRIYIGTEETLYVEADGSVHNEGEVLEESYGNEPVREDLRGIAAEPVTLGENEYFVLGDNRNNSHDSRYEEVGPVSGDAIQGKAVFRMWPPGRIGKIDTNEK